MKFTDLSAFALGYYKHFDVLKIPLPEEL